MEFIDTLKHSFKKVKTYNMKKVANIVFGVLFTLAFGALFVYNYTFGYNVVISGKNIGFVESKSKVESTIDKINETYRPYFSGEDAIYDEPLYALKIAKRDLIQDEETLAENIKSSSGQMTQQFVIMVNDTDVVGLLTEKLANDVVLEYKKQYETDSESETIFIDKVEIKEKYSPSSLLMSKDNAMGMLEGKYGYSYLPVLKVSTSSYETIETEIPFDTEEKEDSTKYMGTSTVEKSGKNGIKKTVIKTLRINGELKSESVVKEIVEKAPVTQVLSVGTKIAPKGMGNGDFLIPHKGTISSRFGTRWSRNHNGVDILGQVGSSIYAADAGVVEFAGWDHGGYGNLVKINHNNGYVSYYAHCNSLNVKEGQTVKKGDIIATLGNTGRSTGPHLHFEIRKNGKPVDPLSYSK